MCAGQIFALTVRFSSFLVRPSLVWFVLCTPPPPHSAPLLLLLLGSVLLSNIYKFNAKFVFEVQQIFNIP